MNTIVEPITPAAPGSLLERVEQAAAHAIQAVLAGVEGAATAAPEVAPAPTAAPVSKPVVKSAVALNQAATGVKPADKPAAPAGTWQFVKLFGVSDVLRFADKTSFKFKLVRLNGGAGYSSSSEVVTSDAALASNLRTAAKNPASGIVEVK